MDDNQLTFFAQSLRAREPYAEDRDEESIEQMSQDSQHPSSVVVKYIRNIPMRTWHPNEREDGGVMATTSTSANDGRRPMRELRLCARQLEHQRSSISSRCQTLSERDKSNTSNSFKIVFAVMVLLSIVSMATSVYVSYVIIIERMECNCTQTTLHTKGFESLRTTESAMKYEQLKEILVKKMKKLKKEFQELQNQTDGPLRCKRSTTMECQTELIDNLRKNVSMGKKKMQLLFNTSQARMNNKLDIVKTRVKKRMNLTSFVEKTLAQINMTFLTKLKSINNNQKLQPPHCLLKNETRSGNQSIIMVHVPQKTKNFVTVSVTCSTSAKNTSKYFYLSQPTTNEDSYTCSCQNDDNDTKHIDCIVYYWQCVEVD